jgi:hypothetical protein
MSDGSILFFVLGIPVLFGAMMGYFAWKGKNDDSSDGDGGGGFSDTSDSSGDGGGDGGGGD